MGITAVALGNSRVDVAIDGSAAAVAATAAVDSTAFTSLIPFNESRDLAAYEQHVLTLANPFFEGRGPGTRGNRIACEYLEYQFKTLGLQPVFGTWRADGDAGDTFHPSYLQEFTAGSESVSSESSLAVPLADQPVSFAAATDYAMMGFSSDADLKDAEAVFVGYAIEDGGPEDNPYSSFKDAEDLTGKVAVLLRFEPMNDQGKSLWREEGRSGWTPAAGLGVKIRNCIGRGASAVVIINPPGADDPRVEKLETTPESAGWMRKLDVPVVLLTPEAGDRLIRATDAEGRSLMDLRRLADQTDAHGAIPLTRATLSLSAKMERRPRITWNVVGMLPGKGDLAEQHLIIGAHYDHVGYGFTGGSRNNQLGVIHPGADDNASGTCGLILAADLLSRAYAKLPTDASARSIVFIGFSAEEMGLIGSRHFVRENPFSATSIYAMLNLDMIGRLRDDKLEVAGTGTAEGFYDLVVPQLESAGFVVDNQPGGRGPSDHASFYAASIPVIHLFTGLHSEYHTPDDTADLLNIDGGVRVTNALCDLAMRLATRTEPLVFTAARPERSDDDRETQTPRMSMKVRFGISPGSYDENETGVMVGEVFPETSAADAGILAGDKLIKWNGEDIGDVGAWMGQLAKHSPGDVVQVTLKRGEQELTLPVTLKPREARGQ